jgi:hypothetical protein
MNKSRRECDETLVQLAEEKKNTDYIAQESEIELEKVGSYCMCTSMDKKSKV